MPGVGPGFGYQKRVRDRARVRVRVRVRARVGARASVGAEVTVAVDRVRVTGAIELGVVAGGRIRVRVTQPIELGVVAGGRIRVRVTQPIELGVVAGVTRPIQLEDGAGRPKSVEQVVQTTFDLRGPQAVVAATIR